MPVQLSVEVIATPDPLMSKTIKTVGKLTEPTKQALALLKKEMTDYPPVPGGSTYKRTGNLGKSWKPQLIGRGGVLGQVQSVGSVAPYNVYVQDDGKQSPHLTHWKTAQTIAKEKQGDIANIYEDWLDGNL